MITERGDPHPHAQSGLRRVFLRSSEFACLRDRTASWCLATLAECDKVELGHVQTDDVEGLYQRLNDRVEMRIELNNTFYGTREFIVKTSTDFGLRSGRA